MNTSIGVFGGTFDPVHKGHITLALELKDHLQLKEMRLVPCRLPPHRSLPSASDTDRLHMLRLATVNADLQIDERELKREGPSYTIDTLQSLRNELGNECRLVLCLGLDAFALLPTWRRWQEILTLAHIAVVHRADYKEPFAIQITELLKNHQTTVLDDLNKWPCGKIYLTQLSQIPVSSTYIRQALVTSGQSLSELDPDVHAFIQQKGLYRQ